MINQIKNKGTIVIHGDGKQTRSLCDIRDLLAFLDVINDLEVQDSEIITNYESYFNLAKKYKTIMPDLRGMSAMDAISLLENMGMRVEIIGRGKVKRQSIAKGVKLNMKTKIVLNLS